MRTKPRNMVSRSGTITAAMIKQTETKAKNSFKKLLSGKFLIFFIYPFYYINYTLTSMGALEFKKKYAEDKQSAWNDYLNLCKVGGSKSYLETIRYANLTVPFDEGSVENAISYSKDILLEQIKKF